MNTNLNTNTSVISEETLGIIQAFHQELKELINTLNNEDNDLIHYIHSPEVVAKFHPNPLFKHTLKSRTDAIRLITALETAITLVVNDDSLHESEVVWVKDVISTSQLTDILTPLGNSIVPSFNEAINAIKGNFDSLSNDNQTETMEMNKEVKLPKTRLFLTELDAMLKLALADNVNLRQYVLEPKLINQTFSQQGVIGYIKRRRHVLELWVSVSTALQRVIETLDAGMLVDTECLQSISHDISKLTMATTSNALESLTNLGYVPVELKLLLDELEPSVLEEIVPETVKETNLVSDRFNQVTTIHRAVEANFEQHDWYFGGYDSNDLLDLSAKGYLLDRDLNDFLAAVIDKEELLPNGITLLELITINNNLAFISDLASTSSPIDSFELYVWSVNKLLPEIVSGEVDVLQQTLNRLKGLAERLHSHTGVANTLNRLFAFGLVEGIDNRGSRSSGMRGDIRGGDVSRDSLSRSRSFGDESEEERYTRQTGRRGRYSR